MYDPGLLYVDPILTNLSVGFADPTVYGEQIMPVTPVNTQSGKYNVFDRSDWLIFESRRAPGTVAHEIEGRKWSTDTFDTVEHSLQSAIKDEERQMLLSQGGLANPVFGGAIQIDPEADAVRLVTRSLLLSHESKVSALVRNPANYPGTNTIALSGTGQWDNYTYGTPGIPTTVISDPVTNILAGMRVIRTLTGRYPNTLAIPSLGMAYIENHPRVVDRFKTFSLTQPDAFQMLTGFEGKIIQTDSMYNAAQNIDAAQSMQFFWGKDVWLGIVDPQPGLLQMTFGKTFAQNYPDGSIRPTDRWREEARKADVIRTSYKWDLKIVSSVAGYLLQNAFSATAW
jgi:hypothetical protein